MEIADNLSMKNENINEIEKITKKIRQIKAEWDLELKENWKWKAEHDAIKQSL